MSDFPNSSADFTGSEGMMTPKNIGIAVAVIVVILVILYFMMGSGEGMKKIGPRSMNENMRTKIGPRSMKEGMSWHSNYDNA